MNGASKVTEGPRVVGAGGLELATYHLGGDGPPVVLMHATGFHARCYSPMAVPLTRDYTVWAVDQRGHGASGKSPDGRYDDWGLFVDDLLAVIDTIGGGQWRGGGHSLGGSVLLMAEAARPGTFAALSIYEPVVMPPGGFSAGRGNPLAELASKRRPSFASREAAWQNYVSKSPFNRFDPAVLHAYVDFGLVDDPEGGVTLACVREGEASVFEGAFNSHAWDILAQVRPPVAVFGGTEGDDPMRLVVDTVARRLPRGGARRFEGLSHFGPFEDPVQVGEAMAVALEAVSGASTKTVTGPR